MSWPAISAIRTRLIAGALLLLLGLAVASGVHAQTAPPAWTNDQSMFLFYQAFLKIQHEGLVEHSGHQIVRQALKRYLEGLDPYSTYLTPSEYQAHKSLGKAQYSGVGMDLYRQAPGRLICLPHPDSPAARAGVRSGDRLLKVDGKPVAGLSLLTVGDLVRGPVGGTVALGLRSPSGGRREVRIKRRVLDNAAVRTRRQGKVLLVRVLRFDDGTAGLLRRALRQARTGDSLVIDLRSCRGGSLFAGVEAADLLLPLGKTIATLRRRQGSQTFASRQAPLKPAGPLFLWQDRYTASSAELMIAALVQNGAARSVGIASFGKASTQKVFPLQDGSALVLTDGRLLGPNGRTWDRRGLVPSLPLAGADPSQDDYLALTLSPGRTRRAPARPASPPSPQAEAKLLDRVGVKGAAVSQRCYVCFESLFADRRTARAHIERFKDKIPPELVFSPVASELLSPVKGKFLACLPPQLHRAQAQERLRVLDRRGVAVLGIREGQAPPAAKPPGPNPEDWFIQVNRFSDAANAGKEARRLEGRNREVMLMVTVPSPQFQARVTAWLKENRLAGEIYLCRAKAKGCAVSYRVLAGPYYAQVPELRQSLLGDWPDAFWLQRRDLAVRY